MHGFESYTGYRNEGLCPIPVRYRSKIPAVPWKRFQTERPTADECLRWDLVRDTSPHPPEIGLITGTISNLVVVDADTSRQVQWCLDHLPSTVMVRTGRGIHFYYRANNPCERNRRVQNFDVRGEGGYVVAPGSMHENGTLYTWLTEWHGIDAMPMFDEEWYYL